MATRKTADGGTITDGVYTPDFDALTAERLQGLLDEYTDLSTAWRIANPLSASRYDHITAALARKTAPPSATPAPIEWRDDRYGWQKGFVGDIELFGAGPSTIRGVDAWILSSGLPGGSRNGVAVPGGADAAKAKAAELLAAFVARITV